MSNSAILWVNLHQSGRNRETVTSAWGVGRICLLTVFPGNILQYPKLKDDILRYMEEGYEYDGKSFVVYGLECTREFSAFMMPHFPLPYDLRRPFNVFIKGPFTFETKCPCAPVEGVPQWVKLSGVCSLHNHESGTFI